MKLNLLKLYNKNIEYIKSIDKTIKDYGVYLFGYGSYGKECYKYLISNNYKVLGIIDNTKSGEIVDNIKIVSLNETSIKNSSILFITPIIEKYYKSIKNSIPNNINILSFDKWFYLKNFYTILNIRKFLKDKKSKKTLDTIIYSKILETYKYYKYIYDDNQYFSIDSFKYSNMDEIFFDAGAYVGDTIDRFINNNLASFRHIYAFEPSIKQFNAMKFRIERLKNEWAIDENKITLVNAGLYSDNISASINENRNKNLNNISLNKSNEKNIEEIHLYSLDSFLNGNEITFLKADIEGGELDMLKGAISTIKKYRPKMAISIYHKPNDIIDIFDFIKSLNLGYNFYIRQHCMFPADIVLYCYADQTRPDQTRPDQTRPDQTRPNYYICIDYICFYNNTKYKKLQPMQQYQFAA